MTRQQAILAAVVAVGIFVVVVSVAADRSKSVTRTYYIAADEVVWDYAPAGMNRITGEPFGDLENLWMKSGPDRIGRVYKKSVYREYTDATFAKLTPRPPDWEHLGMLGPLLRAEVGDTLVVVFKNNTRFPASMHPHGVFYTKAAEGSRHADDTAETDKGDDSVPPGGTFTYVWPVPERAGPAHGDLSSIFWMYHSHVDEVKDVNAGLMGPMIVTRDGEARDDGTPEDVDRELVVSFHEIDENFSHYLDENIDAYASDPESINREEIFFWFPFGGSNFKESLNGFLYGNLPGLAVRKGERVRWYLMGNTNFEVHAPHWHGNTVVIDHMRTDVTSLTSMEMLVADMVPDNPGRWLFHCHVTPHVMGGMQADYTVTD